MRKGEQYAMRDCESMQMCLGNRILEGGDGEERTGCFWEMKKAVYSHI